MNILLRIFIATSSLLLVAYIVPGIAFDSFFHALIAALVLSLLNIFVKPVLVVLTLPVTLLTLGLFIFVINALLFLFAAWALDGFAVESFGTALVGSFLVTVLSTIANTFLK